MKITSRLAYLLLLLFSGSAYPQWIGDIQTESDWEYYFRNGYYDYNTYRIFRELAEGAVIDDTADFMVSALGTPDTELRPYLDQNPGRSSAAPNNIKPAYFPDRVRISGKSVRGEGSGYVSLSKTWQNSNMNFKIVDEKGAWKIDRRSINLNNDSYHITFGDYSVKAACGLGIGRFDYRPVSYESRSARGEDWLYPDNSYYNGIKIERSGITFLYSTKKFGYVRKNLAGGIFSAVSSQYDMGVTVSAVRLTGKKDTRTLGSASLFFGNMDNSWNAEIGYGESGVGICGLIENENYFIKVWRYDRSFIILQSSGYAHPDYVSFTDDRFELAFRQPQSGETGIVYDRKIRIPGGELSGSAEIWKNTRQRKMNLENSVYGNFTIYDRFRLEAGLSDRHTVSGSRLLLESGTIYQSGIRVGIRSNIRVEKNMVNRNESRNYLFVDLPVTAEFAFRGRIQQTLARDIDYFVEQRTHLANRLNLIFTYRWETDDKTDLGPFYIVAEKLW